MGRAQVLRSKAGVVLARWQHLQLASALAAWREAHALRLGKVHVLQACVARLRHGAAVRALGAWRAAVARRAQLHSVGDRTIRRLAHLSLARGLSQVGGLDLLAV